MPLSAVICISVWSTAHCVERSGAPHQWTAVIVAEYSAVECIVKYSSVECSEVNRSEMESSEVVRGGVQ